MHKFKDKDTDLTAQESLGCQYQSPHELQPSWTYLAFPGVVVICPVKDNGHLSLRTVSACFFPRSQGAWFDPQASITSL